MAEALYYLSEDLAWSPASAPRGELVVVTDTAESSGAFLVQHLLALFLKAGEWAMALSTKPRCQPFQRSVVTYCHTANVYVL